MTRSLCQSDFSWLHVPATLMVASHRGFIVPTNERAEEAAQDWGSPSRRLCSARPLAPAAASLEHGAVVLQSGGSIPQPWVGSQEGGRGGGRGDEQQVPSAGSVESTGPMATLTAQEFFCQAPAVSARRRGLVLAGQDTAVHEGGRSSLELRAR